MTWTPPGPALLFCPADRPDRFSKAAARADVVILDLEDAVAAGRRAAARVAVLASDLDPARTIVRVNPANSRDHAADVATVARSRYRCVMLAKAESGFAVASLAAWTHATVLALVETPLGVVRASEIAAAPGCAGLMWGAEDLIAALGGTCSRFAPDEAGPRRVPGEYRDAPRYARASVRLAAAACGRWAVDSVHLDIADLEGQRAEARDAVAQGYVGTACIHPSQVPVIRAAYSPSDDEIAWAETILDASRQGGVVRVGGVMVDGPLIRQARSIMRRAAARAR